MFSSNKSYLVIIFSLWAMMCCTPIASASSDADADSYPYPGKTCSSCGADGVLILEYCKPPSCTSQGIAYYNKCSCGKRVTSTIIPKLDHTPGEIVILPGTCEFSPTENTSCARCGELYSIRDYGPPLGHDLQLVSSKEPGCEIRGFIENVCSRCNTLFVEEIPDRKSVV